MSKATKTTEGFVYFLHAPEVSRIKIGFTINLKARIRKLMMESPTELVPLTFVKGSYALELTLLAVFHKYRLHGEWFHAHEDLVRFIGSLEEGRLLTPEQLVQK